MLVLLYCQFVILVSVLHNGPQIFDLQGDDGGEVLQHFLVFSPSKVR